MFLKKSVYFYTFFIDVPNDNSGLISCQSQGQLLTYATSAARHQNDFAAEALLVEQERGRERQEGRFGDVVGGQAGDDGEFEDAGDDRDEEIKAPLDRVHCASENRAEGALDLGMSYCP